MRYGPFPYDAKYRLGGGLQAEDVPLLAEMGIGVLVNAAPDQEAAGGLTSYELRSLVRAQGMSFADIAFGEGELTSGHVDTFLTVTIPARKVLVACADGERSAVLIAAAQLRMGHAADKVLARASAASFDLSGVIEQLCSLGRQAA